MLSRNPLSPDAEAEGAALAAAWERDEQDAATGAAPRRKRGRPADTYNGRLLVRVPTSVHRALAERAAAERTTINQLVLSYVSHGLGVDVAQN